MKKLLFTFLTLGLLIIPSLGFAADNNTAKYPTVYLYHGEECPHCQEEIKFLDNLQKELPELVVVKKEVWHNEQNALEMQQVANDLGVKVNGVPFTVIGEEYIVGFDNAEGIGQKIKSIILGNQEDEFKINLSFFGNFNIKESSLVLLTALIGILDGFNPCSMWALITMITLILATGDKKKLWLVGWTFIFVSGFSYFLFMSAWLNAFVFLGFISVIRVVIGLIAIGSGIAALNDFIAKKYNVCLIGNLEQQQKITDKFNSILNGNWWVIVVGVAGIAFSVTLVELMCSIGFPVIYTQALALHEVAIWQKYIYIAAYVFFYMLLNIVVLLVAGFSMKFMQINEKYTKYSHLIAGIAMLALGLIFIFKPELLSF